MELGVPGVAGQQVTVRMEGQCDHGALMASQPEAEFAADGVPEVNMVVATGGSQQGAWWIPGKTAHNV
jgi:hypothetical protein